MKCPDDGGWGGLPKSYRSFPLFNSDSDTAAKQNHTDMTALSSPQSDHELDVEPDATPVPSTETTKTEQSSLAVEHQPPTPTSVEKLQSQLRQVLAAMSACKYALTTHKTLPI